MGEAGARYSDEWKSSLAGLCLIFLLSVLFMWRQLFSPYFYSCFISDTWQYSSWAWQFNEALSQGIFYPAWTPLNFWGYGSPTFILYPPLAFYMTALFDWLSGSLIFGMNMTKFISLFAGAAGAYLLSKEMYGGRVATLAGGLYVVFPFYISNLYIGGGFPSAVSLIWFPFILLFCFRYLRGGNIANLFYAGGMYGGLILTHLINAYMFACVIVVLFAYAAVAMKRVRPLAGIALVPGTGAAVSAAYLFAFLEGKKFINYQAIAEIFPFTHYFLFPKHEGHVAADVFWELYYPEFVAYAALFLVVTLLLAGRLCRHGAERDGKAVATFNQALVCVSVLSLFLLSGPSTFIWNAVPFLKYVNISIRWMNITAFAVVMLLAGGFFVLEKSPMPRAARHLVFLAVFLSCMAVDYRYLSSSCLFDSTQLFPPKDINWLPEHLPAGVDMTNIDKAGGEAERVLAQGGGTARLIKWGSASRSLMTDAERPFQLELRTFNFPGWRAYIDGEEAAIRPRAGTKAISIDVPPGRHSIELIFRDTGMRCLGEVVTGAALVLIAGIALADFRVRRRLRGHS